MIKKFAVLLVFTVVASQALAHLDGAGAGVGIFTPMRIAEGSAADSSDQRAAIREPLALRDPAAILKASGDAP